MTAFVLLGRQGPQIRDDGRNLRFTDDVPEMRHEALLASEHVEDLRRLVWPSKRGRDDRGR